MGTSIAPAKKSLLEFKNAILLGLYNPKLKKTCLYFMPKELKHESKIKAVLDHQLVNLRTYNTNPKAPSHDLAGLRSTFNQERRDQLETGYDPKNRTSSYGCECNVQTSSR